MHLWIFIAALIIIAISTQLIRWLLRESLKYRWVFHSIPRRHRRVSDVPEPINIYLMICDHYQPFWGHASQEIAEHRVVTWCREYPRIAREHTDWRGKSPVHTFFYSEEDYNPQFLDSLSRLSKEGIADVELLVSHQHDTPANFKRKIDEFRDVLFYHHGLLRKNEMGQIKYGFIHGYGALNNSRPDQRWCGVDNEIPILKESGCYADFTYPYASYVTQPSNVNSIYFASDISCKPGAHKLGYCAQRDVWSEEDLLLIQGPLALNWKNRHFLLFPSIENGSLSITSRFTEARADLWVKTAVSIPGQANHLFIKLFTHGAIDHTIRYLFSENGLSQLWNYLESRYNDGENYRLFYVSAWEMYNTIKELCAGNSVALNKRKAA